ncbi:FAD binding domain-containing protein [Dictyobacter kobayashii]|uniref:Carbon monoxide dehydrogenase n=1 Tax=Dictyobacter kobayashii TaxID=2014872 RepID=A0A402ANM6_9CHLR|nr:FAD binding domain-containing protein [Dictyobacter kobayashii]GCE20801.1 carbon monoxide dehydrogenase [Dictyobacter kobayashii]
MKPPQFQYCAPGILDEALRLLAQCGTDAKVLAGGQSLIPLLNMRLAAPLYLVDINRVAALDYIDARESYLAVGATVRQRSVEQSAVVQQRHPLLVEVIKHIGHMQIRNRGTLAGSIAHADPAAELPALLSCLDGEVVARSSAGERIIKAEQFFTTYLTTALDAQEIVTEIRFPWLLPQAGWACIEFSRRAGDYALAGAIAVVLPTHEGTCLSARISYFGISATPVRGYEIEQMLAGTTLDDAVLQAAAQAAERLVDAELNDIHATPAYRRSLTAEATRRVLRSAWQRCNRFDPRGRISQPLNDA